MTSITPRQTINLLHVLLIFPLLILVVSGKGIPYVALETLQKIILAIIVGAMVYHVYLFSKN